MAIALSTRFPEVPVDQLLASFVPPPQFADVNLNSYLPDHRWPSQAAAVEQLRQVAGSLEHTAGGATSRWRSKNNLGRKNHRTANKNERNASNRKGRKLAQLEHRSRGVYLDGGFGVGKTHLLASLYFLAAGEAGQPRALYASFVEYTNLVGALGFEVAVQQLAEFDLICIDEFELDDPGDTVLISSLLSRLVEQGVLIATTSNTLPDKLGEGRFAAADFMREIQGLSKSFEVIRIDGDDYRHREFGVIPRPATQAELAQAETSPTASRDSFVELLDHLAQVHPSHYGAMIQGINTVCLDEVFTLEDQSQALRFVALVDRLYDAQVVVVASGVPLDQVFSAEMLAGGFRKKYRRAISRLIAISQ